MDEIYVQLLNEGAPCVRPVPAVRRSDCVYRIEDAAPLRHPDEEWMFKGGSVVRCRREHWSDVDILVAYELVNEPGHDESR